MLTVGNSGSKRVAAARNRQRKESAFLDTLVIGVNSDEHVDVVLGAGGKAISATALVTKIQKKKLDPSLFTFRSGESAVTFESVVNSIKVITDCSATLARLSAK